MSHSTDTIDLTHLDVREIPCRSKHARIFQRWTELPIGMHFVLINDHDPVPLYYQFAAQYPGAFTWEYLEQGPDVFHVKITRVGASPLNAVVPPLPTSCGGHAAEPARTDELDLRGLQPPEPMLRILEGVSALAAGGRLRARTDRKPIYLLPELDSRGIRYTCEEQADGSWSITLERA